MLKRRLTCSPGVQIKPGQDMEWELWATLVLWHFHLSLIVFRLMNCFPAVWVLMEGDKKKKNDLANCQCVTVTLKNCSEDCISAPQPCCRMVWDGFTSKKKKKKKESVWGYCFEAETHARKHQIGLCCYLACNNEPNISFISLLRGLSAGEGQNNWEESLALLLRCHNTMCSHSWRCWTILGFKI